MNFEQKNNNLTLSNQMISLIKSLKIPKFRKEKKLFIAEGKKVCFELLNSDYKTKFIVINKDKIDFETENLLKKYNKKNNFQIFEAKNSLFETFCDAKSPQEILSIGEMKPNNNANIMKNTSFVALDNISDPGNVGTIIRTANWFGIKQIFLLGNCANQYNPKVIRSAMGSTFKLNIFEIENSTNIFKEKFDNFNIFAASLDAKKVLQDIKIDNFENEKNKSDKNSKAEKNFGLIVGNEVRGISDFLDEIITEKFLIKGFGEAESLNVAIATGISLFHLCNE
jgi:TrmH family RNA methyltransferase